MAKKRDSTVFFRSLFFRHIEHLRARTFPPNKPPPCACWQAIQNRRWTYRKSKDLIKQDPSLCYRLLRYRQLAPVGLSRHVYQVRHSFNVLGERELGEVDTAGQHPAWGRKISDFVLSSWY